MNDIRKLREQIDACRPGREDLALPELAELAGAVQRDRAVAAELERSQRFDRAVAGALHNLPLPVGLQERLLATVEANKPSPAQAPEPVPRWWTRRSVLVAMASLAAVALVSVTVWQFSRPVRQVSKDELSLAVAEWAADGQLPTGDWTPGGLKLGVFAPPTAIKQPVNRWRWLPGSQRAALSKGVAIHYTPPGSPRAMLFVFSSTAKVTLPAFPVAISSPSGFPGGRAVAWQNPNTKLIYVLFVVEDGGQRLEDFLPKLRSA